MNQNETCKYLCQSSMKVDETQIKFAIDNEYKVNFVIDNLPAVSREGNETQIGFPVGFKLVEFLDLRGECTF